MKKYKYGIFQIVTGILLIAAILSSCEDFLNEVPGDKITPDQHYRTSIDGNISTVGAYSLLQEVMPNLVIMNDLRSDLLIETENFDADLRNINRHNIDIENKYNDPSGHWVAQAIGTTLGAGINAFNSYDAFSSGQMTGLDYSKSIVVGGLQVFLVPLGLEWEAVRYLEV